MNQIVCISYTRWSTVPGRTQQLIARMRDAEILWFEPLSPDRGDWEAGRKVRPNIIAYSLPMRMEGARSERFWLQRGRRKLWTFVQQKLEKHRFRSPLFWLNAPGQEALIDGADLSGLVYECGRYWPDWMAEREGLLAAQADVIFAASQGIADRLSPCNRNLVLLPNGVNYPMFSREDYDCPRELEGVVGPVFGWAGGLPKGLDTAPLELAAARCPDWTFAVLGAAGRHPRREALERLPNVRLLGRRGLMELPDCLGRFDVCLRLRGREGEDDVLPEYLYQYLATGKPIVSMLYPGEVEEFPDVIYGAHSGEEFLRLCGAALTEDKNWVSQRRRNYGKAAAWSVRAAEAVRVLERMGLYQEL